jgi:hypothetical protein
VLFDLTERLMVGKMLGSSPSLSSIVSILSKKQIEALKLRQQESLLLNDANLIGKNDKGGNLYHIDSRTLFNLMADTGFERELLNWDSNERIKNSIRIAMISGRDNLILKLDGVIMSLGKALNMCEKDIGKNYLAWVSNMRNTLGSEIEPNSVETDFIRSNSELATHVPQPFKSLNFDDDNAHVIDDLKQGSFEQIVGKNKNKIVDLENKKEETLDEDFIKRLETLNCVNNTAITDWQAYPDIGLGDNGEVKILIGNSNFSCPINVEVDDKLISPKIINFWEDQTAMVDGIIPLPRTNINLRGSEMPTNLKEVEKTTLVKYPTHGQPNYTVRSHAGLQAMSELFGSKLTLRTVVHNPIEDADKFVRTYFARGSVSSLPQININHEDILKWLKERPDKTKIAKDVDEILSEGWDIHGLDRVNVHLKLESRMKDVLLKSLDEIGMPDTIEDQRVRLIVWQRKGITTIFAGLFLKAKEHLKRVLPNNVLYADGYTPKELAAEFNRIESEGIQYVEDDLAKQDRQTDMTLIKTEMEIYKRLGVNPGIVDIWESVHHMWKAKGCGYKFDGDASRLTGQATTSLGNAIVNLMVKEKLVHDLGKNLKLMAVLGDDNIMLVKGHITEEMVKLHSARHFNMVSKPEISKHGGTFLRMMVYPGENGHVEVGPDFVRLRRKYEVTNGVSEGNELNLIMRKLSYCCMIGDNPMVQSVVESTGYKIDLQKWYNYSSLKTSLAFKYKASEEDIENEYAILIQSLKSNAAFNYKKLMFISKRD